MPYYGAGDYYRGDYYRGDNYAAGGLGSFLKGVVKTVGGGIGGFLTGGPVGAVRGAAAGAGLRVGPSVGMSQSLIPTFGPGTIMSVPEPGITGTAHRLFAGGKPGFGRLRKDGGFTDRRRPRMNALNPRALSRALRREAGFLKFARRVGHFAGIKGHYKLKRGKKR